MVKSVLFFLLALAAVRCEKCSHNDISDYVECLDISSMRDVSSEIMPTWKNIIIVNRPGAAFTIAESETRYLDVIEQLDLSRAGALVMSDHGFKDYTSLSRLIMTQNSLPLLKNSWFRPNNGLEYFDISQNRIRMLTDVDVENLQKVELANFSYNAIETIQKNTFSRMLNLEVLDLDHNNLKNIDIGEVPHLKTLSMSNNVINIIPSNGFSGMKMLKELVITYNPIRKIEDRAFLFLTRLKVLNLSENSIEEIHRNHFVGLSRVRLNKLDLSSNNIRFIEHSGFEELPFLQILDLSRNSISEVNENTFKGLRSLRHLYLHENDIDTIGDYTFANLQNLEILYLNGNNLRSLNPTMFGTSLPKLKKLFLTRNSLAALDPSIFLATPNIYFLSFGYNEITHLPDNIFLPLRKLTKLHLQKNLIEEFTSNFIDSLDTLEEFLIDHNKLTFIPDTNNTFSHLVKVHIEGNPWQCPCLDEIMEFIQTRNIQFRKTYYFDGRRPVCVATPSKYCVKNMDLVRRHRIVELYKDTKQNSQEEVL